MRRNRVRETTLIGFALAFVQCGGSSAPSTSTTGSPESSSRQALSPMDILPPEFVVVATPNMPGGDNELFGVSATASDDAWASDVYLPDPNKSPNAQTEMLRWDGSAWNRVATPNPYPDTQLRSVVAIAKDDAWAVGFSAQRPNIALTEHWDGTRWTNVNNPVAQDFFLLDVAAGGADDVWAVGENYYAIHWDGKRWNKIPTVSAVYEVSGISEDAPDDVWAVGYLSDNGFKTFVERWDGKSWTQILAKDPGPYGDFFEGVAAVSPKDVWAVGAELTATQNVYQPLLEHWDGTGWKVYPSPSLSGTNTWLLRVRAVASNDVWAFGLTDLGTLVLHWNGGLWTQVPSQNPGQQDWFQGACVLPGAGGQLGAWAVGTEITATGAKTLAERLVE